jgi:hypothetical protein
MTMPDIPLLRLSSQHLARTKLKKPGDVVAWMGAIQAQDYAGAKWSIGLRLAKATEAGIEQAIDDKKIVRTWAMRGTLHFVSPQDIQWMLGLLAPRIIANNARRYKELKLDGHTFMRCNDVIANAMQSNGPLDRPALVAILEKKGISTAGQRTPYLLQRAALDRIICQGVMRSNNPTFFLLGDMLLKTKTLARDEALAELASRYFKSRGPAAFKDFVWWSGLSVPDARAALDAAAPGLASTTMDNTVYWQSRTRTEPPKETTALHLLPGFDEYLLSYKDRSASMDVKQLRSLTPANGMLPSTIVMNGRVVGMWKRTIKKDMVVVDCRLFVQLGDQEQRALAVAVNHYGEFLGKAATLVQSRSKR